jgi:hypothetical protein
MTEELLKYHQEKQRKEQIEHRDVLLAIGAIVGTKEGQQLFKYLFKNLEVNTLPDITLKGEVLHESLGFLRAGNSIYKLACEAASETTAHIMAKIERERYEELHEQYRIENGLNKPDNDDDRIY